MQRRTESEKEDREKERHRDREEMGEEMARAYNWADALTHGWVSADEKHFIAMGVESVPEAACKVGTDVTTTAQLLSVGLIGIIVSGIAHFLDKSNRFFSSSITEISVHLNGLIS